MGHYWAHYLQVLHGIPYLTSGVAFIHLGNNASEITRFRPNGEFNVTLYDKDSYALNFNPIKEENVLVDDVPLLPFSEIKNRFEEYIETGLARNVRKVWFGYMLFDKEGEGGFILKPVWIMSCDLYDSAKQDDIPITPDLAQVFKETSMNGVVVDAQTGVAYTMDDVPASRTSLSPGQILTWNDI